MLSSNNTVDIFLFVVGTLTLEKGIEFKCKGITDTDMVSLVLPDFTSLSIWVTTYGLSLQVFFFQPI